ncbi:MAG: protein sorting system archaetidylserine decarboxylase [Halorientalis sp.]
MSGVAPGTWRYALPVAAAGLVLLVVSVPAGALGLAAAAVVVGFHRDPDRTVGEAAVVAPADGRVSVLREEDDRLRVGVFMGLRNVHVNRAPIGGTVQSVSHSPGKHWPAFTKESDRNEKVHVEFADHAVTLVAGAVARRIHPYVAPGDAVARGERVGHISFSSRVDVLLPPDVTREDLLVERGDRVRAGETPVATR